jgi:hypothetical protein
MVAVGAAEEQFGQRRSIKKIGEIHQIIRVFFWNRNMEKLQSWDVRPVRVRGRVGYVEVQMC